MHKQLIVAPHPSEQEVAQDIARQAEELKKALLAKGPQFSLAGPVEILKGGLYSIGGEEFRINSETEIVGDLKPGAMTEARGPFKPKSPKIAAKVIVHDSKNTTAGAEQGNHSRVDGMR
jgi:hypothetical protein